MKAILVAMFILISAMSAIAERSEFRDRHNNLIGTRERSGQGFDIRDRHNNLIGTARRQGDRIEFRDRNNNFLGDERRED